ncbi:hypothetical protein F4778DRAFT_354622 [Xylariomycetidae sp. FL2044]|nr:hypothetical protein F4778DRAFT_354622 [Xylariomycetidae sp. FL2044]
MINHLRRGERERRRKATNMPFRLALRAGNNHFFLKKTPPPPPPPPQSVTCGAESGSEKRERRRNCSRYVPLSVPTIKISQIRRSHWLICVPAGCQADLRASWQPHLRHKRPPAKSRTKLILPPPRNNLPRSTATPQNATNTTAAPHSPAFPCHPCINLSPAARLSSCLKSLSSPLAARRCRCARP